MTHCNCRPIHIRVQAWLSLLFVSQLVAPDESFLFLKFTLPSTVARVSGVQWKKSLDFVFLTAVSSHDLLVCVPTVNPTIGGSSKDALVADPP